MSPFFKKIVLAFFAFFFAFLVIESAAKIYNSLKKQNLVSLISCKKRDTFTVHSFNPNTHCKSINSEWSINYDINSFGARDSEHSQKKEEGVFRILLIGDSFIEGVGVNNQESIGKILENNLKQQLNKKIEVIQMGVAGWSPLPEYLYISKYGIDLNPDLVIITFNSTDFRDEYYHYNLLTDHGKSQIENKDSYDLIKNDINLNYFNTDEKNTKVKLSVIGKVKRFLTSNSVVFSSLENIKKAYQRRYEKDIKSNMLSITDIKKPNNFEESFIYPEKSILKINEALQKNNINLLVVFFPHGHVINNFEWPKGRLGYGFRLGVTYSNKAHENLSDWAKNQGIISYDLLNTMQDKSKYTKLFFEFDGHWTANGHKAAGEGIAEYIYQNKEKIGLKENTQNLSY